jgi:hypothetical protein
LACGCGFAGGAGIDWALGFGAAALWAGGAGLTLGKGAAGGVAGAVTVGGAGLGLDEGAGSVAADLTVGGTGFAGIALGFASGFLS